MKLLFTSFLFLGLAVGCGGGGSDSNSGESVSDTIDDTTVNQVVADPAGNDQAVENSTAAEQTNTGDSIAGFWDFSTTTGTNYQDWTDDGFMTIYDPDDSGLARNCFETTKIIYERTGNTFVMYPEGNPDFPFTQTVVRTGNTLTVSNEFGTRVLPPVSGLLAQDLNVCE